MDSFKSHRWTCEETSQLHARLIVVIRELCVLINKGVAWIENACAFVNHTLDLGPLSSSRRPFDRLTRVLDKTFQD